MTDITDEQRAAVEWLQRAADPAAWERSRPFLTADRARVILDALPSELTNPQPVLPTEPGAYHDARGTLTIIDPRGKWHGTYGDLINPDLCPGPFTRLVPERPQITRQHVKEAVYEADTSGFLNDEYIEVVYRSLMNQVNDRD